MPSGSTAANILTSSCAAVCAFRLGTSASGSGSCACAYVSAGAGARISAVRRRRRRRLRSTSSGHLEGDDAAKGAGGVVVGNLEQADALLAVCGALAGGAGGDGESDVEVLVDVGGALLDDARVLEEGADVRLLGDAARAIAPRAGHVGRRVEDGAVGELARPCRVHDGLDGPAAVRGHDVEDARDRGLDLREGTATRQFLRGDY